MAPDSREQIEEEVVLPVVEERVRIDKAVRDGRTVTVRTRVVEDEARVVEELHDETVEVRRVPVGRPVDATEPPRQEGDTLIVPVYEEQLVVTRQVILKEEIHLVRRTDIQQVDRVVPVARTEVDISED